MTATLLTFLLVAVVSSYPWSRYVAKPLSTTQTRNQTETSFSCNGRPYGFYADVGSDCHSFYVCQPVEVATGRTQYLNWTFTCPEDLVFNQEKVTCTPPQESIECENSAQFYNGQSSSNSTESVTNSTTVSESVSSSVEETPDISSDTESEDIEEIPINFEAPPKWNLRYLYPLLLNPEFYPSIIE